MLKLGLLFVLIVDANYIFNPEEHGTYLEGDLVVSDRKNALMGISYHWPNGEVPYEVIGSFSDRELKILCRAMMAYHIHTCIRFRPRKPSDSDYLQFDNQNTGCWSSVGRSSGAQLINFQSDLCFMKVGTTLHEMMHSIGFLHEQNRLERDNYIKVLWENIKPGHEGNFKKAEQPITAFGLPYDYKSILHYSPYSFSKNRQPTIVVQTNRPVHLGQRQGFSCIDLQKINALYNCTKYLRHPSKSTFLLLEDCGH